MSFTTGVQILSSVTTSSPVLGPTQSPIQSIQRTTCLGVMWSENEADH